jgi:hypothetical protein
VPLLHISLSKTLHLLEPEIQPFAEKVKKAIALKQVKLPVLLLLKRVIVIDNFIAAEVHQVSHDKLLAMAQAVQQLTKVEFYPTPIFHISLFKVLSPIPAPVLAQLAALPLGEQRSYSLESCCLKTGSAVRRLS